MFTFKSELKFPTPPSQPQSQSQSQVPLQTTTTKFIDIGGGQQQLEEDELAKDEPQRKKRRIEVEQIREIKPGGEGGGNESVQTSEERKDTDEGSSIETTIKSSGSPSRRTTM